MLTYEEAYQYIIRSYSAGEKHDRSVLRGILGTLGNPQDRLKYIHVAGTNGKGSVCVMLSSILKSAGYSVGMFTSPHLHKFNERFRINDTIISDTDFAKYIEEVKNATHIFFKDEASSLSFFELLTACAFLYFCDKDVDYVVLEVGIGGRLDVTNIIENPLVSVITSIGIDHTEQLGDTIPLIAAEKAGIIKKNCKAVLYLQGDEVYNTINDVCNKKNSELYYAKDLKTEIHKKDLQGICFSAVCEYYRYENISINLLGDYQILNACTALLAVSALRDLGIAIADEAVYKGMYNASWAGRMEIVGKEPLFILEGAHNADGARELQKSFQGYFWGKSVTLLLGILKNKDYESVIRFMTDNECVKNVILTQPIYKARAMPPDELVQFVSHEKNIFVETDYIEAVKTALKITLSDGVICCSGSLYLVGDVRKYLLYKEERHD